MMSGKGKQMKIPTEVPIDETLEFTTASLGFIPFSHYQGRDYACFFSANSTQKAQEYDQKEATANSRVNTRLPYIFLASRIAHYLKVIQRENIGTTKDRGKIEKELNDMDQVAGHRHEESIGTADRQVSPPGCAGEGV